MTLVSVPLRGLWFEIDRFFNDSVTADIVSVPLRGLWFEMLSKTQVNPNRCISVSVPLRGLWFEMMSRR